MNIMPNKWFWFEESIPRSESLWYFQTLIPVEARAYPNRNLLEYEVNGGAVNHLHPRELVLSLEERYSPRGGVE